MIVIGFTGQDGAGKSSQINLLREKLASDGTRVVVVHQYEAIITAFKVFFPVGKFIANLVGRESNVKSINDTPSTKPAFGLFSVLKVLIRYTLSMLSLLTGWIRVIINFALHRRCDVLILDRCYIDEIIRAVWKFGYGRRVGIWVLRNIVPKPDIVFTFTVNTEIGWCRKKTKEMTLQQYQQKTAITQDIVACVEDEWPIRRVYIDGLDTQSVAHIVWSEIVSHVVGPAKA